MSKLASKADKPHELSDRDVRALTQYLTVLPDGDGTDIYRVVSQSGKEYIVDIREGVCTCNDYQYRKPAGGCKHQRRVAYATGRRSIPSWINADAIDPQLGLHTDETPVVAASDGGVVTEKPDKENRDDRPDDCGCWSVDQGLPCFPCFRDGFDTPNPGNETQTEYET